ncbi:MAG: hypothetical protein MJB14_06120 [Spirochaetes bacterium]|nr:hypothetical protein [Spirochaetota bacterium]
MNCHQSHYQSNNCCGHSHGDMFISKKKKLEVLNHYLECLDEKKKDIQEAIKELKTEK